MQSREKSNGSDKDGEYKIAFKEPFSEKYRLIIDSDNKGVSVSMQSKAQVRWNFRVIAIDGDRTEIELLLLDHSLLDANNPLIKDLAQISQVFGKMYSELHLIIDSQGKVLDILNLALIQEKWARTRSEMEAIIKEHPEIKDVILINDATYQDPEKIKKAIQESEFFMLYFYHLFGAPIPTKQKEIKTTNFLRTAFVDWKFSWFINLEIPVEDGETLITLEAKPVELTEQWYQEAYKQFAEMINIRQLRTDMAENGNFRYDKRTGKLLEAKLFRTEIADKELFSKTTYTLMTESEVKKAGNGETAPIKIQEPKRKLYWERH
jgi:hypothetical protein